ncbi:MGMT family protein [Haloferula sargassicola]|uniref:Methylated-DNA--protein-cysteine methyltransferase n=1 Tax=Haloferula sargassicola TaxID=490096 RepID=A0ABP9UL54_9BACT
MSGNKPSLFAQSVYDALGGIPAGKVTTYKELARSIGCGSPRAVGQALRRNPDAPQVPCHRVVRTDGDLGGYQGRTRGESLARKESLLRGEGVEFLPDGRVDLTRSGHHFGA